MLLSDKEVWEQNLENKERKVGPSDCLVFPPAINRGTRIKFCVGTECDPVEYFDLSFSLIKN